MIQYSKINLKGKSLFFYIMQSLTYLSGNAAPPPLDVRPLSYWLLETLPSPHAIHYNSPAVVHLNKPLQTMR